MSWFEGEELSDKDYRWFADQCKIIREHDDWTVSKEEKVRFAEKIYECNRNAWILLYEALMNHPVQTDYERVLALLEENSNENQRAKYLLGKHKLMGMGIDRDYHGVQLMLDSISDSTEATETIGLVLKFNISEYYVAVYNLANSRIKNLNIAIHVIRMQIEGKGTVADLNAAKTNYEALDDERKLKLVAHLIELDYDDDFILDFIKDERYPPIRALANKIQHVGVPDDELNVLYSLALEKKPWFKEYLDALPKLGRYSKMDILLMVYGLLRKEDAIAIMHYIPCLSVKYQLIHEINIGILQQFDMYCKLSGVAYMISSGTLLGAVRHGGPIPWDDDIDAYMFLDDIKRLERYLVENDCPFKIQEFLGYGHFYKFRTTSPTRCWIDIFPLQYLEQGSSKSGCDMPQDGDKPQICFTKDCHPGTFKYRCFDYDDIFPIGVITYAGLKVSAPNNPDSVLTNGYGSYCELPSKIHPHMTDSKMDEYIRSYVKWNNDRFTR